MLNPLLRYQTGLTLEDIFPFKNGVCACGCNEPIVPPKKKWASQRCNQQAFIYFAIVKGDTSVIRQELYIRDRGMCQMCGCEDLHWQADHIIPVIDGGGACGLDNFQTLCTSCHQLKTLSDITPV